MGDSTKTKEYVRPIPKTWWMHNRHLVLFMVREFTSVFVAGYAVFLLVMMFRAGRGQQQFDKFFGGIMQCGWTLSLQILALVFVVFHTVTWFNLTPKAMVVWCGDEKVSPVIIAGVNYAAWIIVSGLILIYAL